MWSCLYKICNSFWKDIVSGFISGKSVEYVYGTVLRNSCSPYLSTTKSKKPRDKKLIYNCKNLIQSQENVIEGKD